MRRIVIWSIVEISYSLDGSTRTLLREVLTHGSGVLFGTLVRKLRGQISEHAGHLHVLKKGRLKITRSDARQMIIDTPSILFFHVLASIAFTARWRKAPNSYA